MKRIWSRATVADRLLFMASLGVLTASVLVVSVSDRRPNAASEDEEFYRFVDVAAEVYSEIRAKYVDEVEPSKVLESALTGMFKALDEHSQYLTPDMLKSLEKDTSGEFTGIGIHISSRQGVLTVIAPIPGTPAADAGLQPWDRIVEIEGESTEGMTIVDAVQRLTGPAGTSVSFKVWRAGEEELLDFTIKRANVEVVSVHSKMLEGNIAYVRLVRFSENTTRDARRAILDLKRQGAKSLILDLRFNSGGLLSEAISISDMFVEKGDLIVSTKGRLRGQNREYRAESDPIVRMPTFVLVNEGSASASEIVAGALQDHALAVIIGPAGKNTFGKGSVQTIGSLNHTLSDDADGNPQAGAMRLTTARYYTPSGRSIHHLGITPDIGVPIDREHEIELIRHGLLGDVFTGEDWRLPKPEEGDAQEEAPAGAVLQNGAEPEAPEGEAAQEGAESDKEFYRVDKPEMVEDDFVDVVLEEAVKQMKIYMILEGSRQTASRGGGLDALAAMAAGGALAEKP